MEMHIRMSSDVKPVHDCFSPRRRPVKHSSQHFPLPAGLNRECNVESEPVGGLRLLSSANDMGGPHPSASPSKHNHVTQPA